MESEDCPYVAYLTAAAETLTYGKYSFNSALVYFENLWHLAQLIFPRVQNTVLICWHFGIDYN